SVRFGDDNYYFIHNYDGVTLLHTNRALEGKNRIGTVDSDGVYTVRSHIEAAKRGGDYVYYRTPRTGGITAGMDTKDFLSKVAYCIPFEPWQWTIGAGVYLEDVDVIYRRMMLIYLAIAAGIILLCSVTAYLIGRSISRPLSAIGERMNRLAD